MFILLIYFLISYFLYLIIFFNTLLLFTHKTQTHTQIKRNIAAVETIQCHKPTMIERRSHHYSIIIRRGKMEICHSNQYRHRNRRTIDRWFQATEMQTMEICHLINGTPRFVFFLK